MKILWLDTETTGLNPVDSSAFQIAMIIVFEGAVIAEKKFCLNPLSETILYHEDAGAIHGYSEQQIREFKNEKEQVKSIIDFLDEHKNSIPSKSLKFVAAGYNVKFDYNHFKSLVERNGYKINDYFSNSVLDVFNQVKNAGFKKVLPYLKNRKLGTVCSHLGVNIEKAHDALNDIKATREVAKKLHNLGIPLIEECL
ncbi:MAG: 3'-5' exonuclease [Treponemataceae bacterium]